MNEILQKRIDEAAEILINYNLVDLGDLVNQYDLRRMLIEMGVKTLQNQWISLEEALPEDKTKVFVIVKTPVGIIHRADYHINDYWYMSRYSPEEIVTHWMPIPSLEGGVE
jgi:hypothetical protein